MSDTTTTPNFQVLDGGNQSKQLTELDKAELKFYRALFDPLCVGLADEICRKQREKRKNP